MKIFLFLIMCIPSLLFGVGESEISLCNDADFRDLAAVYLHTDSLSCYSIDEVRVARSESAVKENRYFFISTDVITTVGYQGVTTLAIVCDDSGVVDSLAIIDSEDTPHFVRRVNQQGFLKRFIGFSGEEKQEIIPVSGATLTSNAIIKAMDSSIGTIRELINKLNVE